MTSAGRSNVKMNRKNGAKPPAKSLGQGEMLRAASVATAASGAASLTANIRVPCNFDSTNPLRMKAVLLHAYFAKIAATLTGDGTPNRTDSSHRWRRPRDRVCRHLAFNRWKCVPVQKCCANAVQSAHTPPWAEASHAHRGTTPVRSSFYD